MRLNALAKIDSVPGASPGAETTPTPPAPPATDPLDEWFRDFGAAPGIGNAPAGDVPAPPPWTVDPRWLNGDVAGATALGNTNIETLIERFSNLPPRFASASETLRIQAQAMPDYFVERYTRFVNQMTGLRNNYLATSANPATSAAERSNIERLLTVVDAAIARGTTELRAAEENRTQLREVWRQEMLTGADINDDNWIGQSFTPGAYFVQIGADGEPTYFQNGQPVSMPIMVEDYTPQLFGGNTLNMISEDEAEHAEGEDPVDLYLRINPDAYTASLTTSESNPFGTFINFTVPPLLYVREGSPTFEDGENRLTPINSWTQNADGNIVQARPENMEGVTQVTVDRVELESGTSSVRGRDGEEGSNQYIKLYHGDQLIARIRIEGSVVGEGDGVPEGLAVRTAEDSFLYASAVSFRIDGGLSSGTLRLDATNFKSNVQHVVEQDAFNDAMDVTNPTGTSEEIERGRAAQEAIFRTMRGGATRDRYVASETDTSISGLFGTNLGGDLTLTQYNDAMQIRQANEYTEFTEEHLPRRFREVGQGDATYNTAVRGEGGTDAVSVGRSTSARGNTYLIDVSFAEVKAGSNDNTFISTRQVSSVGNEFGERPENWATYVHVNAGTLSLNNGAGEESSDQLINNEIDNAISGEDNPSDARSNAVRGEIEDRIEAEAHNDYYKIDNGTLRATDHADTDIVGRAQEGGLNKQDMLSRLDTAMDEWWDEITRAPNADASAMTPQQWQELINTTSLQSEMDSFFDEWMGGISGEIENGFGLGDEPEGDDPIGGPGGTI